MKKNSQKKVSLKRFAVAMGLYLGLGIYPQAQGFDVPIFQGPQIYTFQEPRVVTVSPDGKQVYVLDSKGNKIVAYNRSTTGDLAVKQTIKDDVNGVDGLSYADELLLSPDGKNIYVSSLWDDSIASFQRPIDGSLTYQEIVDGDLRNMAMSPDGKYLYGSTTTDGLEVFKRNADGTLDFSISYPTSQGIFEKIKYIESIKVSPDGKYLYVVGESKVKDGNYYLWGIYSRSADNGSLALKAIHQFSSGWIFSTDFAVSTDGKQLYSPTIYFNQTDVNIKINNLKADGTIGSSSTTHEDFAYVVDKIKASADGKNIYVTSHEKSNNAVNLMVYQRNADGTLVYKQRHINGVNGVKGMSQVYDFSISPDGKQIYVVSADKAVVIFDRNTTNGNLTFKKAIY